MEEFSRQIRERRKFLKITQIELAEITGISRRSLQEIESGKSNPSVNQLLKILEALGMEMKLDIKGRV